MESLDRNAVLRKAGRLTFSLHASLETLAEAAILTLVTVMLVDGAVASGAARVREVATD